MSTARVPPPTFGSAGARRRGAFPASGGGSVSFAPSSSTTIEEGGGFGMFPNRAPVQRFGDFMANSAMGAQSPLLVGQDEFGGGGRGSSSRRQRLTTARVNGALNRFGTSQGPVVCLLGLLCLFIFGVILLSANFTNLQNANKSGCTFSTFDNFNRGFGIDNGSCVVRHREGIVEFCSASTNTTATYFDGGGPDADYNASISNQRLQFESLAAGQSICFDFLDFDIATGSGPGCPSDSLTIENARDDEENGVYCGSNEPPRKKICNEPGRRIAFTFNSDESFSQTGWKARIECGRPGCTQAPFSNFESTATVDDRTCLTRIGDTPQIEFCGDALFYDSGGADANYGNDEVTSVKFSSSVLGKIVCFEFISFSLANVGPGACSGDVFSVRRGQNIDASTNPNKMYCNNNGVDLLPLRQRICSQVGSDIQFVFSSDSSDTAAGWVAYATCIDAP